MGAIGTTIVVFISVIVISLIAKLAKDFVQDGAYSSSRDTLGWVVGVVVWFVGLYIFGSMLG